ncbi:MAG: hypothetical protein AAGJ35_09990 [Myxococcota bacterium]
MALHGNVERKTLKPPVVDTVDDQTASQVWDPGCDGEIERMEGPWLWHFPHQCIGAEPKASDLQVPPLPPGRFEQPTS